MDKKGQKSDYNFNCLINEDRLALGSNENVN